MRFLNLGFLFLFIVYMMSGCEKKYTYSAIDENLTLETKDARALSQQVLRYWNLASQGKYSETFEYELAYQQYIKPLDEYLQFHKGNATLFHITLEEIVFVDKNTAMVKIRTYIRKDVSYSGSEKWIKIDNTWTHKVRLSKLPGHSKKEV